MVHVVFVICVTFSDEFSFYILISLRICLLFNFFNVLSGFYLFVVIFHFVLFFISFFKISSSLCSNIL